MTTEPDIYEKQKLRDEADQELNAHENEAYRRHKRELDRAQINTLVGVNLHTDEKYSYLQFKVVMQQLWHCKFERTYLRQLYRTYQSKRAQVK